MECLLRKYSGVLVTLIGMVLLCDALPLQHMNENLAIDHQNATESNPLSTELIASHQDLHPIRVPDDEVNLANISGNKNLRTLDKAPNASSFSEIQKELQPLPALDITRTTEAGSVIPEVPNVQRANATQIDKLMMDLHIPIPNPNSSVIQHKSEVDLGKPMSRDLLPSIVASGNKELSPNPAGNPGVPPAAAEQAKGNLPKELMVNPFGSSPAVISVGAPM